jgi:hypothetical protein
MSVYNRFDLSIRRKNLAHTLETVNEKQRKNNNNNKNNKNNNSKPIIKKEIKTEYTDEEMGNSKFLNSSWTVWVHSVECTKWTEDSYEFIFTIDSIGSFWRFFDNFHKLNKSKYHFFIMRDKIKPVWEDNYNRNGGICSYKANLHNKNNKDDDGSAIMISMCLLILNETFIKQTPDNKINGISYSLKNMNCIIKIWYSNWNDNMEERIPINLEKKIKTILDNNEPKIFRKGVSCNSRLSIRYSSIKPEFEKE